MKSPKAKLKALIKRETAARAGAVAPPLRPSPKGARAVITETDAKRNLARAMEVLETQLESSDADVARRAATAMSSLVQRNQAREESDPDEHQEYIALIAAEGVRDFWPTLAAALAGAVLPTGAVADTIFEAEPTDEQIESISRYLEALQRRRGGGNSTLTEDVTGGETTASPESLTVASAAPVITPPPPEPPKDRGDEPCKCGEPRRRHEGWALACADCGCPLFTLQVIE